jgi:hypothetical protein
MFLDASGAALTLYFENVSLILSEDSNLVKADTECAVSVANFRIDSSRRDVRGILDVWMRRLARHRRRLERPNRVGSSVNRSTFLCHMGSYRQGEAMRVPMKQENEVREGTNSKIRQSLLSPS